MAMNESPEKVTHFYSKKYVKISNYVIIYVIANFYACRMHDIIAS